MKAIISKLLFFALSVGLSAAAIAQYAGPITHVSGQMPVEEPFRGTYYDTSKPGTGIFVDYGHNPNGTFMFVSYYSYNADGSQKYYLFGGNYTPNAELVRAQTGIIGRMTDGVIYTTAGGEVVNGVYKQSTPTVLNIPFSLTWYTTRRVVMTIDNSSWNMTAGSFTGTPQGDGDLIPGRWGLSMYVAGVITDGDATLYHFTVDATPAPFTANKVTVAPGSAAGVALPPSTANWYTFSCVSVAGNTSRCNLLNTAYLNQLYGGLTNAPPGATPVLAAWVDPVSGRAGLEMLSNVSSTGATLGPNNWHFDLYAEPNRMSAHGIHQLSFSANYNNHLDSTLLFEKVPQYMIDYSKYSP